jgi:hypothetical protein
MERFATPDRACWVGDSPGEVTVSRLASASLSRPPHGRERDPPAALVYRERGADPGMERPLVGEREADSGRGAPAARCGCGPRTVRALMRACAVVASDVVSMCPPMQHRSSVADVVLAGRQAWLTRRRASPGEASGDCKGIPPALSSRCDVRVGPNPAPRISSSGWISHLRHLQPPP